MSIQLVDHPLFECEFIKFLKFWLNLNDIQICEIISLQSKRLIFKSILYLVSIEYLCNAQVVHQH